MHKLFRRRMSWFRRIFSSDKATSKPPPSRMQTNSQRVYPSPERETPPPPRPPSPLCKEPWRKYKVLPNNKSWPEKYDQELLKQISEYEEVNILLVGQIQSGKSSIINSMMSIVNGRITERAKAGQSEKSLTIQLNSIHGSGDLKNVVFFDLMGLELSESQGLKISDILRASKGKIAPGTILNPSASQEAVTGASQEVVTGVSQEAITGASQDTIKEDTERKIHCIMYIADGENVEQGMAKDFQKKIVDIEEQLKIGPNRVVLVTKVDNICPEVRKDIQKIFHSKKVETAVKNASRCYQVTLNKVHPVKNYVDEMELDEYTNIPLLLALKAAVELGVDFKEGQRKDNFRSKNSQ